jgi:3-phosphoshikimate 1-carboxyvinyltransferase
MSTVAQGKTVIKGTDCTAKSYPSFFDDFVSLGGITE